MKNEGLHRGERLVSISIRRKIATCKGKGKRDRYKRKLGIEQVDKVEKRKLNPPERS